ncbi:proteasome inhibitor PI31 subunit-like [Teleopsis dalmanni]|uniref:proteasome inhibitor PI31 subunit-like n=1 Tax=Teleopsis dalmanni TaxID=139649 RepID=UPI000D32AC94|nr:proteasome inhibitor PI31 subunit-like [Teleopsis dalmanni]XP_037927626.1 proteasome inhibitor PI31 subunit-like [Teleopsis dalmanni]
MSSSKIGVIDESYFFGWDMLLKSVEKDVLKKADVILALAHFILVRHYKFECLGVGEDKTYTEDEVGSELLPEFWNDSDFRYRLRYVHNKQLYLLIGHVVSGDKVLFNLLSVDTKQVSNILFDPEELVKSVRGKIYTMIPDAAAVSDRIRKELIETVMISRNEIEASTQTDHETVPRQFIDPLRMSDPPRYRGQYPGSPYRNEFPDVGRGDLDPFGVGGGNLYPFPRPDLLGSARPRFDPFGPPGGNVRSNPNPDHFRPPGNDDYYM